MDLNKKNIVLFIALEIIIATLVLLSSCSKLENNTGNRKYFEISNDSKIILSINFVSPYKYPVNLYIDNNFEGYVVDNNKLVINQYQLNSNDIKIVKEFINKIDNYNENDDNTIREYWNCIISTFKSRTVFYYQHSGDDQIDSLLEKLLTISDIQLE